MFSVDECVVFIDACLFPVDECLLIVLASQGMQLIIGREFAVLDNGAIVVNPQPCTLDPKTWTLNPKRKPQTQNPKP